MEWPNGSKFAVFLSHDVDRVRKQWWQTFYYFLTERKALGLFRGSKIQDPYWNFEAIMELEERYSVRSTFFFLNESLRFNLLRPCQWKLSLGRYRIQDKRIQEVIRKLKQGGWEIAAHGSYNSYMSEDLLVKEKRELEAVLQDEAVGIRQHYLNLEIPGTWQKQRNAGFKYDASFGYVDRVGFREKHYSPFFPFNDDFMVIPLVIMDECLMREKTPWQKVDELINSAEQNKGLISVLWHNKLCNEKEFPLYMKMYEEIIRECKVQNAWFGTGEEIYNWVKQTGYELS